jgi:hypothetical protein
MKTIRLGLPLALLVALAACASPASAPADPTDADDGGAATEAPETDGGDGGDGGDVSGYDLCDAISEEEVSEITGAEVTDSTSASSSGVLSCNYNSATTAVAGTTLTTPETGLDPQDFFDANREGEGVEEVPDLGDAAVMTGDDDFPILMVMVNGNLYNLSVLADNLDGPGKREATIELARLSVDRLP